MLRRLASQGMDSHERATLSIALIHVRTKQGSCASTDPPARESFLSTLTMPFSLCLLQKEPFSSPFQLKAGLVLQPFSAHLRCLTFTMPSCRRQTAALNTWGTGHNFEVLVPQRHLRDSTFARLDRMMWAGSSGQRPNAAHKHGGTCLCWLQNSPRDSPGMLKEARVVHPSILQWGWTMSIMPGSLCLLQNLPFCSPR